MKKFVILSTIILLMNSCGSLQKSAKQNLTDGFFKKKSATKKTTVYVDVNGDSIHIHHIQKKSDGITIDSLVSSERYPFESKARENPDFSLIQNSFDIDIVSIPLKLRFAEKGVPPQLNTNLNGAVYLGYRTDIYKINYLQNPLQTTVRQIDHFGYSFGFFSGFGNTFMSPTNTQNILQQEYDGIVWSKGIAGIIGINNFTVGLSIGFDNLLDKNKDIWIYQKKPWIGLAFGLNLN